MKKRIKRGVRKRKGVWAMEYIAHMILALVFVIVVLVIVDKIRDATHKGFDKELCKMSVVMNTKVKKPLIGTEAVPIDCPTRYVTIGLKEIKEEIPDRDVTITTDIKCREGVFGKASGFDPKDKDSVKCYMDTVNKQVANLMYDCWDQFGMGKLAVFDFIGTERRCVLCSVFSFDKEVEKEVGYDRFSSSEYSFDSYMRNHKPLLHDISYWDFVYDDSDSYKMPYYEYKVDQQNAIIFTNEYDSRTKKAVQTLWDTAKCGPFNAIYHLTNPAEAKAECTWEHYFSQLAQPPEMANTNSLIDLDEVTSYCDVLK